MTGKIKLVHSGGNSVSIAVPTSAPSASEVEFKLPQADGSANQYIKTDGSGNLGFATLATTVPGITEFDIWNMLSSKGNGDIESAKLERYNITGGASQIGTGMTESSGIFSFPNTGKWLVICKAHAEIHNADSVFVDTMVTINNSSYTKHGRAAAGATGASSGQIQSNQGSSFSFIDVTDTSNVKVKFTVSGISGSSYLYGDGYLTQFIFIRLGDT